MQEVQEVQEAELRRSYLCPAVTAQGSLTVEPAVARTAAPSRGAAGEGGLGGRGACAVGRNLGMVWAPVRRVEEDLQEEEQGV